MSRLLGRDLVVLAVLVAAPLGLAQPGQFPPRSSAGPFLQGPFRAPGQAGAGPTLAERFSFYERWSRVDQTMRRRILSTKKALAPDPPLGSDPQAHLRAMLQKEANGNVWLDVTMGPLVRESLAHLDRTSSRVVRHVEDEAFLLRELAAIEARGHPGSRPILDEPERSLLEGQAVPADQKRAVIDMVLDRVFPGPAVVRPPLSARSPLTSPSYSQCPAVSLSTVPSRSPSPLPQSASPSSSPSSVRSPVAPVRAIPSASASPGPVGSAASAAPVRALLPAAPGSQAIPGSGSTIALGLAGLVALASGALALAVRRRRPGRPARVASGPTMLAMGIHNYKKGEHDRAAARFQAALAAGEGNPDEVRGWLALAVASQGHLEIAQEQLGKVDPAALSNELAYDLASAFEKAGHVKEARRLFGRVYMRDVGFRDVSRRLKRLPESGRMPVQGTVEASLGLAQLPPRYSDLAVVSRGAMGVIVSATDRTLGRKVALKVVAPQLRADQELIERFQREARALASLSHPNVVQIYDVQIEPLPYIAMEWVQGKSLETIIEKSGPLPVARVLKIGLQVSQALAYLHGRGFLHRDVKPDNVILLENERAKLVDFGLAFHQDWSHITQTDAAVGTPQYMAPEMLTGGNADGRADVFSLGIVLCEALFGTYPFSGAGLFPQLAPHAIRLHPVVRGVTPTLDALLRRAIEHDMTQRVASAAELAAAIGSELESLGRREGGIDRRRFVELMAFLRDAHADAVHPLKGALGVVRRSANDPLKAVGYFFSPENLKALRDRLVGRLASLLAAQRDRPAAGVEEVDTLARALVEADLVNRFVALESRAGEALRDPARSAAQLGDLYQSAVDLSTRIGQVLARHAIHLGTLLETARSRFPLAEKIEVIDPDTMPNVPLLDPEADGAALGEVLHALFTNAFEAGATRVTLALAPSRPGAVVIRVVDDGPGLDPGSSTRLFRSGYTTKAGGSGTGLSRSREILTGLGGAIDAEPGAVRGARFSIALPSGSNAA